MVYCGKPSGACEACRALKSKCDKRPNGCTQCRRSRRICPGYRNTIDLMFRDQSAEVARKSRKEQQRSTGDVLLVKANPSPDIAEVAICYFVHNYVRGTQSAVMGIYDMLMQVWDSHEADVALVPSLGAASLASFACLTRQDELIRASQRQYLAALNAVNSLVSTPDGPRNKGVLVSVLLLALNEVVAGNRDDGAYTEHIHGAASLLSFHVHDCYELSPAERMLFGEVANLLLRCCLDQCTPIPRPVKEMVKGLSTFPDRIGYSMRNMALMVEAHELITGQTSQAGSEAPSETASVPPETPKSKLERLTELDDIFDQACRPENPGFAYETYCTEPSDTDLIFGNRVDVYSTPSTISMWNVFRTVRMYLHAGICSVATELNEELHATEIELQAVASADILAQLQADILASVPQQFGLVDLSFSGLQDHTDDDLPRLSLASFKFDAKPRDHIPECLSLLWPLTQIQSLYMTSPEVRCFCSKVLKEVQRCISVRG